MIIMNQNMYSYDKLYGFKILLDFVDFTSRQICSQKQIAGVFSESLL